VRAAGLHVEQIQLAVKPGECPRVRVVGAVGRRWDEGVGVTKDGRGYDCSASGSTSFQVTTRPWAPGMMSPWRTQMGGKAVARACHIPEQGQSRPVTEVICESVLLVLFSMLWLA